MGRLIEKSTGKSWEVPPDEMESAIASGLYDVPEGETTTITEGGYTAEVAVDELSGHIERGAAAESATALRERREQERKEREHSGLGSTVGTALESFADTATLGGYGLATDLVLGEDYTTGRRERGEVHDIADTVGTVAGVVAPALASGGTGALGSLARSSPIGMAERLGQRIVKSGAEKGLAQQLGRSALGYGVEGALIGAGEGVQEVVLSEDPVSLERAMGMISSKALYGGVLGGGIGAAGKAIEKGFGRARGMLDDAKTKLQQRGGTGDLAGLDKAGLREAKRAAAGELGEEVVENVRAMDGNSDLFRLTVGADKKVLADSRKWLTKHLDDPKGLAENPNLVAKSLRKEEEILRKTISDQAETLAKFQRQEDQILKRLSDEIGTLSGSQKAVLKGDEGALYGALNGVKVTRKRGVSLDRGDLEEFRALIQSGAGSKMRREAMERLPKALDDNLALQGQIAGIKNGTAPRLAEIQAAQDAFSSGGAKAGMLEQAAQGSVFGAVTGAASFTGPLAPLIGAKVSGAITDIVFGRLAKAGKDAGIRSAKALDAFLDASKKAARVAPPLASRTLSSVAFGLEPSKIANALAQQPKKGLAGAYLAREKELRSITMTDENGELQMQRGAREELSERLAPVRMVDPVAADMMETIAARKATFLASKLPQRPGLPIMQVGPDRWRPSDMAIRQFSRFVAAVEDPGQIEERLADGSVTPEDAEAMREVYPEMYEDIKLRIVSNLAGLRESLPYKRRLALSIFSGVPVDPAMEPRILAVLQGSFAEEPGSDGGTQAPKAQPQFGSISKPNATAAQERAG